jgi:hypothetical protein
MGDVIDFNAAKANPPPRRLEKKKKKKKKYGLARAMEEFGQLNGKQHAPKKDGEQ